MPVLSNPKHELFAQELAKGKTQIEAHGIAGYRPHGGNSCTLEKNKKIQERVAELLAERDEMDRKAMEKAIESLGVDKAWVMGRLVENANRAMQAVPVIDDEGRIFGYRYEGSVANRALELLGKELGMFIDRKEIDIKRSINEMSEDELLAILAEGDRVEPTRPKAITNGSGGLH